MKRLMMVLIFLLISVLTVQAQSEDDKRTPIDSYPLPRESGAIRYSLADRWNKLDLTFFIHNCPSTVDCNRAQDAVRTAFQTWDEQSGLRFSEASNASQADIELLWTADDEEFGTRGDVLAYAYFPSRGGDVYFDDVERWSLFDGGDTDLYVVAVHEIGHALGLDHSEDTSAVMYAFSGYASGLGPDDIAGIQQLYGPDDGTSPDVFEDAVVDNVPSGDGDIEMVDGTLSNRQYYDEWIIDANAGETIILTLEVTSGDLDPYLVLFTPDGEEVLAEDDDSLGGLDSSITFTFPTTDEYLIIASRYDLEDGFTTGDYRLTAYRNVEDTTTTNNPPGNSPSDNGIVTITLMNFSDIEICEIYITPTDAETWGENLLGSETLPDGFQFEWEVSPDDYDIAVGDCFDNFLEDYYFPIYDDTEIEIYDDHFNMR